MLKPKAFLYFFAFFFAFATHVSAQKSILFKLKYLPNHNYTSTGKTLMDMSMNFAGNKEQLEKLRAKGIKTPMILKSESFVTTSIKTGAETQNTFPIVIKYLDAWGKQTVNGQVVEANQSPLLGQTIYAHNINDSGLKVDSMPGKQLNDTIKNALALTLNSMMQQVKFPPASIKVGDTFQQDAPLSIPVSGMAMDMNIKIVYKFTGIVDNIALFDLAQTATYNLSKSQNKVVMNMLANGSGTGKLQYYIDDNMIKNYDANLTLNYKMHINEMTMTGLAKVETINSYTIQK